MNFALIRKDTPVIHHYTSKSQYWGHAMQEFKCNDNDVEFESLTTYSVSGSCFSEIPLYIGDFISRDMKSGWVGLFEIQSAGRPGGSWPRDFYNFRAIFCGYLNGKNISIIDGYGIQKPSLLSRIFKK